MYWSPYKNRRNFLIGTLLAATGLSVESGIAIAADSELDIYKSDHLVTSELIKKTFEADDETKILLIAGQPDHRYLIHMYMRGCSLLAKSLRQNLGVDAVINLGWPTDSNLLTESDAIAFYSGPVDMSILNDENMSRQLKQYAKAGKRKILCYTKSGHYVFPFKRQVLFSKKLIA